MTTKEKVEVRDIVKKTIRYFLSDNPFGKAISCGEINNGKCSEFAEVVIERLGGYQSNLFELDTYMFLNDKSVISDSWKKNDLIQVNASKNIVWSKSMLDYYGYPPLSVKTIFDLPTHVWVYFDGIHYDAESPNGERSPWKLKIFKRFFNKLLIVNP